MKKMILGASILILTTSTALYAGANAGIEQEVYSGETVQLNGFGSTLERDGRFVRFNWRQTEGDAYVSLSNNASLSTSFTAPIVKESTVLTFRLTTKEKFRNRRNRRNRRSIFRSSDFVNIIVLPKKGIIIPDPSMPIDKNDEYITFKGFNYLPVISPKTGRVWLDRNLGARNVCSTANNVGCFGDLYQWGREADGHERRTSPTVYGGTNKLTPSINSFFTSTEDGSYFYVGDWTGKDSSGKQRSENWSKIDGSSVCPIDYRVPTIYELSDENDKNFLKLANGGFRDDHFGSLENKEGAYLWSTTTLLSYDLSSALIVSANKLENTRVSNFTPRTSGYSIRCIKD